MISLARERIRNNPKRYTGLPILGSLFRLLFWALFPLGPAAVGKAIWIRRTSQGGAGACSRQRNNPSCLTSQVQSLKGFSLPFGPPEALAPVKREGEIQNKKM